MKQLILNPRFEQSIISLFQRAKCNDIVASTDMQDISNETPHELGTIEEECDENSCQVESDNVVVGMSCQDRVYVGDAGIVGAGACEDTIISEATSVLVEPSNEEFSSIHAVVDVSSEDSTLVIDDEASDAVAESCYTIDQHNVDVHFMDNPMFDMDATWSYDNPLFEVDVDHTPEWSWTQFSPAIGIFCCNNW